MIQNIDTKTSFRIGTSDELDILGLIRTLWIGRWWIAMAMGFTVTLAGLYVLYVAMPTYSASATVALESREQSVVDFDSVVSGLGADQSTINTELEVLRSQGLTEKLVRALDLTRDPEFNPHLGPPRFSLRGWLAEWVPVLAGPDTGPRDAETTLDLVINAVLDATEASNLRGSMVFRVTATTEDARKSALIANTLAQLYIRDQVEVKFDATAQATEWLSLRVADLRAELDAAQTALRDYTATTEFVTPEEIGALSRQIADLRARLTSRRAQAQGDAQRVAELVAAVEARDWETTLDLTEDRILARLLDQPQPLPDALAARGAALQANARDQQTRSRAQITALTGSLTELERQIAAQADSLVDAQGLERSAEQAQVLFEYFQNRLRETSVQQGIQQADARVLSRAMVPRFPSAPRESLILLAALALGGLLGIGGVLVREMRQTGVRSAQDLEALTGVTVMGQLPLIRTRNRRSLLDYLARKPRSHLAEAFRNLRTSVLLSNLDTAPQIIMSTSSLTGEGKTTQSLALSQNFARMGKSVLLVECDIRRRVFTSGLGCADHAGLLAVLSGATDLARAVQRLPSLGAVDILIGDASKANPVDVFSSESFRGFLREARTRYDIIVIDTPPVLAVPDGRVIAQEADAVLFTVKWNTTPRAAIREGLRLLETVNAKVSGLVLSQIDHKGMQRYGYGAYHKNGKAYYAN